MSGPTRDGCGPGAEDRKWRRLETAELEALPAPDLRSALQELRAYQIELEMQNQELRRTQGELSRARDRFSRLFEDAPTGYVVLDRSGIIHQANRAFADMAGTPSKDLAGRSLADFIAPADRHAFRSRFIAFFNAPQGKRIEVRLEGGAPPGREVRIEGRPTDPDRTVREASAAASRLLLCISDISDLKQVERTLAEQERYYRSLLHGLHEDILVIDRNYRVVDVNNAMVRTVGRRRDEIVGRPCHEVLRGRATPCAGPDSPCDLPGVLATGEPAGSLKRLRRPDGTTVYVDALFSPLKDAAGRVTHVIEAMRDVTDQKRFEEEKDALTQQFLQIQKLEAIGALAGGIAHDFNNILFPIISYVQMVMDDLPPGSGAHASLAEVMTAAQRAKDLVRQILSFSRQKEAVLQPVRLQDILKEVLKLIRSTLPATIAIEPRVDAGCGPVLADPTQVHQVLMNLATNALHAMEGRGGRLGIRLAQVARTGPAGEGGPGGETPWICLEVSDTGVGMPAEVREKIFDPYFTTKEIGKGTGLGLAVVHGIVRGYGGDIAVDSAPGRGTTFRIHLPVQLGQGCREAPAAAGPYPGGNETVLVVDDEAAIVRSLAQMLARIGYRIETHTDPQAALAAYAAAPRRYDLLLTDMTMPRLTGIDLMERVRRVRPDLPVIIATGFSEQLGPERAAALGVDGLLFKPVLMNDLATTLRRALDRDAAAEDGPAAGEEA